MVFGCWDSGWGGGHNPGSSKEAAESRKRLGWAHGARRSGLHFACRHVSSAARPRPGELAAPIRGLSAHAPQPLPWLLELYVTCLRVACTQIRSFSFLIIQRLELNSLVEETQVPAVTRLPSGSLARWFCRGVGASVTARVLFGEGGYCGVPEEILCAVVTCLKAFKRSISA